MGKGKRRKHESRAPLDKKFGSIASASEFLSFSVFILATLIFLSFATYSRNTVWKNDLQLWGGVARKSPEKAKGYYNLGLAYSKLSRFNEAIQEYKAALRLSPNDAEVHYNLGNIYKIKRLADEAWKEFKTALQIRPDFTPAQQLLKSLGK